MNKYAVCTYASGESFCNSDGFKTYISSLKNIPNADFFIFTHDMPESVQNELSHINIVKVDKNKIHYLMRDRNLVFYEWMCENYDLYESFLFTDSKDVIFQDNPFEFENINGAILASEGMKHKDSLWNLNDQSQSQINVREFTIEIQEKPVINGGIIMGNGPILKNHFLLLWTNTIRSIGRCTDQGILNYLYQWLEKTHKYTVMCPLISNFCLTGEGVKQGVVKSDFRDDGCYYYSLYDQKYAIVHQWDRLPEKELIIKRYKNGNS